jgi:hypothetical protein
MATVTMLTFLAALLPACTHRTRPPAAPALRVALEASFERLGAALTVDYTVVNDEPVPVVVFNGVPGKETTSSPRPDPDAVYVTAGDDGTVELAKRLFPVPAGVDPAAHFLLRGTVLAPGARLSERVTVPLPLRPRVPYGGAMSKPPSLPDPVRRVRFCVGSAHPDALHPVPDSPIPSNSPVPSSSAGADPRPIYAHAAGVDAVQHLACSSSYDLAG